MKKGKFDMRVFYAEANYGEEEIAEAIKVLREGRLELMCGKKTSQVEDRVAKLFRKEYGIMTNSGSSANLLGIQALGLPVSSKVITPALTFSTTVAPIVQSGLTPLFLDVDPKTLQLDVGKLGNVNLDNVSAICVPNLIGNVADWNGISEFAKQNNLLVIEDSADTIGYDFPGKQEDWSDVSTTSFYASHVVTGAGFGGVVTFKDKKHSDRARSLRGWGRRSSLYGESEDFRRRFDCEVDGIPYDDKYVFDDLGYNFLPSEISAAFALVQLEKLQENIENRAQNFQYLANALQGSENFKCFDTYEGVKTGWLAFPVLLNGALSEKRKEVQIFLEENGIQTRTIFTGNIIRQPVSKHFEFDTSGTFDVSDNIMRNGILLGCHNRMSVAQLDYLIAKLFEAEKCLL